MTKKSIITASVIVAAAAATAAYILLPKQSDETKDRWLTSVVTAQHITQSVTATGTVEPVTTVDIGTQVSGILTTLHVDYNSVVKEGQVIAELDKSTLILDLNSKKNSLNLSQSEFNYQKANYNRVKGLFDKGLIADSEYELALYNYERSRNNLEIAKNNLEKSETNLGYATIYSPIDGVVLSRSVEEGQTVASSFNTPTLFTVAADLKDMRIIANVDEADIGNVKEGQKAKFSVDAFPLDTFDGVITQVRQEAIIESNVVTYEVVISAANPDLKLKPGLTANVEILTLDKKCEMTVSSSALSFKPKMPEGGQRPQRPNGEAQRGGKREGKMEMSDDVKMIWIKKGDAIEPRRVQVGVTNGILTEISGKGISPQDSVITGIDASAQLAMRKGETSPFAPKRPGQGRK